MTHNYKAVNTGILNSVSKDRSFLFLQIMFNSDFEARREAAFVFVVFQ